MSLKQLTFFLICLQQTLWSFQPPTHEIIMLLDYKEEEAGVRDVTAHRSYQSSSFMGAMTCTFIIALYQKAAPLLVSSSLVKNVLQHKALFEEFASTSTEKLLQKYGSSITWSSSLSTATFKQHCSYTKRMYQEVLKDIKKYKDEGGSDSYAYIDQLACNPCFSEKKAPPLLRHYTTPDPSHETLHQEMYAYALCAYAPLTQQDYIIKEVSPDLMLLIPHAFLDKHASLKNYSVAYKKGLLEDTPLEKRIGLRVNHLPDIDDLLSYFAHKQKPTVAHTCVEDLSKLFIKKAAKPSSDPRWTIYLSGHGLPAHQERIRSTQLRSLTNAYREKPTSIRGQLYKKEYASSTLALKQADPNWEHIICSLPLKEFQELLEFFDSLSVSLLFYTTCYGGGEHLVLPYKNKILSYDIISGTLSENVSLQDAPMLFTPPYHMSKEGNSTIIYGLSHKCIDLAAGALRMHTTLFFDQFFSKIKQLTTPDYGALIMLLHPYVGNDQKLLRTHLHNTAHIKRAFSDSFVPLVTTDPFCIVRKKTAPSRTAEVFLLADNEVPRFSFPKAEQGPSLLSLLPGKAWHRISSLDAHHFTLSEALSSFLSIPDLATAKLFWIKKLKVRASEDLHFHQPPVLKDVIITRNIPTYEAVLYQSSQLAYVTDSAGITYCIPLNGSSSLNSYVVPREAVHQELFALFPGLRKGSTNSKK